MMFRKEASRETKAYIGGETQNVSWGYWLWVCGLDSSGSGWGQVAGFCECDDEPSGSCAADLVSYVLCE
jgi:hypothetical protein